MKNNQYPILLQSNRLAIIEKTTEEVFLHINGY